MCSVLDRKWTYETQGRTNFCLFLNSKLLCFSFANVFFQNSKVVLPISNLHWKIIFLRALFAWYIQVVLRVCSTVLCFIVGMIWIILVFKGRHAERTCLDELEWVVDVPWTESAVIFSAKTSLRILWLFLRPEGWGFFFLSELLI